MNYSRFLNSLSKNRLPSTIREITGLLTNASPELVFLASGMPNPDLFPFHEATVKLKDGSNIVLKDEIMTVALQYGPTNGYPPLLKHLKSLVQQLHHPPLPEGFEILVTPGSQDGLCKAIEMLIMPNDYFITQDPCYSGTLAILKPYDPKFIPLECDSKGVIPKSLKSALSKWNAREIRKKVEDVPKVIYINPNAANPSGVSQPAERRREIYGLASEFDLIILEDDPYYFVQFDDIENFPPSYLSLDKDGRVLRFDSFSKVLSSGVRLGFVSGPKKLIDRIMLHMQASVLHASSLSQVLVSSLFDKWGEDGFLSHTTKVQQFYKERRDVMLQAAQKHLTGLCEWSVPTGGMFLWMKIHGVVDTWDMVMKRGLEKNVILVPGRAFSCDSKAPSPFLRAAFSLATPEQMERGMKSLAMLIQEEVMIQSSKK